MTKTEVAQITSRGSVHKCIQELKSLNYAWDVIKVKLREDFLVVLVLQQLQISYLIVHKMLKVVHYATRRN